MVKNKKIILTGASAGIGAELCKILSKENKVIAVARNISNIPAHLNITPYSCDISQPENIEALFLKSAQIFDEPDIFIANAGFAYYEKFNRPDWPHIESIFNTNVGSVAYSLAKMKEIKQDKPFNFVITASAMSFMPMPGYALYVSTKYALKGLTDAYRFELSKGQNINMVYPIATLTSFFDVAGSEKLPWPRQEASTVAHKIVSGIYLNKNHIFPSKLFRVMLFINKFAPALMHLYFANEKKKIKNLKGNLDD